MRAVYFVYRFRLLDAALPVFSLLTSLLLKSTDGVVGGSVVQEEDSSCYRDTASVPCI